MPTSFLEINFFATSLPDVPLPFLLRARGDGEGLRRDEREWPEWLTPGLRLSRAAVLVRERRPDDERYESKELPIAAVTPGIVKPLLERGLQTVFERRGWLLVRHHLTFDCFDPNEVVQHGVPPFLTMRRGLEFRPDHLSSDGRRVYGFFVSVRAKQDFAIRLEDPRLAEAATGETVHYPDAARRAPARSSASLINPPRSSIGRRLGRCPSKRSASRRAGRS